ncbi:MAG: sigma-54-dependent Fis family transcriptional regulator [Anaerovoracaceae bacterium]|jgi:transcriptional regulator of acetoin/glycerol metabolism
MSQFTKIYQERLKAAWEKFISGEEYDYSFMRPEVLDSWKRSREAGVDPHGFNTGLLDKEELEERIQANRELIDIVHPYVEKLYSIVSKGSGFYILFCDKDGYILDLVGDDDIIKHGREHSLLVIGANRRESMVGTNAIGTCIVNKKPIQLWNEEHYKTKHKDYVCSGAPFFDAQGNVLGCLAITGRYQDVHPHTLGMVASAVDGISKELRIREAYDKIEQISAQRNSIIESMTSGLMLLNESYQITHVNSVALRMLDLREEDIMGKKIFSILSFDEYFNENEDIQYLSKEVYNKESAIHIMGSSQPPQRFNISVSFVRSADGAQEGTVVRFNEAKTINRLVNRISGYNSHYTFQSILGESPVMRDMIDLCKRAAASNSNVLILGESGTGKELIAQSMHNQSPCAGGPFVAINCAALPKSLVESELFGYEKGAFTGASKEGNPGKFELADGGTIFLDEIGDMPLDVQVSLLRVIQTREIVRIGGKYPKPINVRIIAATNRNLEEAIAAKTFREDLYYRLNVLTVNVPPLRARGQDVSLLADAFIEKYNLSKGQTIGISDEAMSLILSYSWPGNIRELENAIERAVNIIPDDMIRPEHLPPTLLEQRSTVFPQTNHSALIPEIMPYSSQGFTRSTPMGGTAGSPSDEIAYALQRCGGNVTEAAKMLGISRRTLYRKMDKYRIDYEQFRMG